MNEQRITKEIKKGKLKIPINEDDNISNYTKCSRSNVKRKCLQQLVSTSRNWKCIKLMIPQQIPKIQKNKNKPNTKLARGNIKNQRGNKIQKISETES